MLPVKPLPYRKVAQVLTKHGFKPTRQRGSHVFFEHADGRCVVVPHRAGRDFSRGFVKEIWKQAGLLEDDERD